MKEIYFQHLPRNAQFFMKHDLEVRGKLLSKLCLLKAIPEHYLAVLWVPGVPDILLKVCVLSPDIGILAAV